MLPGHSAADEFFAVRDENPLIRGFYLPLPSDSRLTDGTGVSATLSISNTLNVENRGQESLLVDGENDVWVLSFDHALAQTWRYRLTVPIIHDSGGFLDSPIDHWHRWFGFDPGNRPYYPRNEILYVYSGKSTVDIRGAQTGSATSPVNGAGIPSRMRTERCRYGVGLPRPPDRRRS